MTKELAILPKFYQLREGYLSDKASKKDVNIHSSRRKIHRRFSIRLVVITFEVIASVTTLNPFAEATDLTHRQYVQGGSQEYGNSLIEMVGKR